MLPPQDPRDFDTDNTSIQIPKWLKKRLDEIADREKYSRNRVIVYFLKWALQQYEVENPLPRPAGKR